MKTYFLLVILWLLMSASVYSQTIYSSRIKSMRMDGQAIAGFPLVFVDGQPVTITFDVDETTVENFRVRVIHCDKNWKRTASNFINDDFRNFNRNPIEKSSVPAGVKHYRWTYSFRIPGSNSNSKLENDLMTDFATLPQSGNYKIELWNEGETELLAEAKFFAVEKIANGLLKVDNQYLPSEISPMNQVNKAVLTIKIPSLVSQSGEPLMQIFFKTVDIYRNREIENPRRIDTDNHSLYTFVDGQGTQTLKFIIEDLHPGNEYRRLDVRNIDYYPPDQLLKATDGSDLSRWLWQGPKDHEGTSVFTVGNRYAEYVQYQFRLARTPESANEKIYIVADFNGWQINDRFRMSYNSTEKQYQLTTSLRRGAYDYQYVINGSDWYTLEGNDWRTVCVYTALAYYHDPRFGGFDRIVLAAQTLSPGGSEPTIR